MPCRKNFILARCFELLESASASEFRDIFILLIGGMNDPESLAKFARVEQISSYFYLLVDSIQILPENEFSERNLND